MEKFNLEKAKAGAPVCTRDGRDVRIICYNRKSNTPIVALIEFNNYESTYYYTIDGIYQEGFMRNLDLFMKDTEPTLDDYTTIKTYEDACKALGEEPLITDEGYKVVVGETEYIVVEDHIKGLPAHILSLMKLETISRALRNGWKPSDCRSREDKVYIPEFMGGTQDSVCWQYIDDIYLNKTLCQETAEKAIYLGKQFIDIWKEYLQAEG